MRAIRILLQIVFGLLSAVVLICLPDNDFSSSVTMLLVFALIIVFLGHVGQTKRTSTAGQKMEISASDGQPAGGHLCSKLSGRCFLSLQSVGRLRKIQPRNCGVTKQPLLRSLA